MFQSKRRTYPRSQAPLQLLVCNVWLKSWERNMETRLFGCTMYSLIPRLLSSILRIAWERGYFSRHMVLEDTYYKQTCITCTHPYVLLTFCALFWQFACEYVLTLFVFIKLWTMIMLEHIRNCVFCSTAQMRGVDSVVSDSLRFSLECLTCVRFFNPFRLAQ